jgi:predicted GNAT family acetyltransferase
VGALTIRDDDATRRYEALVDGEIAGFLAYATHGDRIALLHTEVLPTFEGQGIGSSLAAFALDDARGRGRRVVVRCPFVRSYVDRHPEVLDVVEGADDR